MVLQMWIRPICPIVQFLRFEIENIGRLDESAFEEPFEIRNSKLDEERLIPLLHDLHKPSWRDRRVDGKAIQNGELVCGDPRIVVALREHTQRIPLFGRVHSQSIRLYLKNSLIR